MASIYVHIPFCKKKCNYCDFYSVKTPKDSSIFRDFELSIIHELELRKDFTSESIKSIYFGGGTPSNFSLIFYKTFIENVLRFFKFDSNIEITIEVNPEDVSYEFVHYLKNYTSINRISLGIQSLNADNLLFLSRLNSVEKSIKSLEFIKKEGFSNISVDFIYGFSLLTENEIIRTFKYFKDFDIQHISAYHLSIEPNTLMFKDYQKGKFSALNDIDSLNQFKLVHNFLSELGYNHYEISNFSRPGLESVHNSGYWNGEYYLGLGPSAHSFYNNSRFYNVSNVFKYIDFLKVGNSFYESEELGYIDKFNEFILLNFRQSKGIDLNILKNNFDSDFVKKFEYVLSKYLNSNFLTIENNCVKLTLDGLFISDSIISDFFIV